MAVGSLMDHLPSPPSAEQFHAAFWVSFTENSVVLHSKKHHPNKISPASGKERGREK